MRLNGKMKARNMFKENIFFPKRLVTSFYFREKLKPDFDFGILFDKVPWDMQFVLQLKKQKY